MGAHRARICPSMASESGEPNPIAVAVSTIADAGPENAPEPGRTVPDAGRVLALHHRAHVPPMAEPSPGPHSPSKKSGGVSFAVAGASRKARPARGIPVWAIPAGRNAADGPCHGKPSGRQRPGPRAALRSRATALRALSLKRALPDGPERSPRHASGLFRRALRVLTAATGARWKPRRANSGSSQRQRASG